jgi:hypothetical protein
MASPTTPTHGKFAAVYRYRPNGFSGSGLNDLSWGAFTPDGTGAFGAVYVHVVIDGVGSPNTFSWYCAGYSQTGVAITGAAQTLLTLLGAEQIITFGSTTGHALGDQWVIGHFSTTAPRVGCTISGNEAQITDADYRVLNPNATITFTDTGGETVLEIFHSDGRAKFTGNPTAVTVTGDNAFIPRDDLSALQKVAMAFDWSLSMQMPFADTTHFQAAAATSLPGELAAKATISSIYVGDEAFADALLNDELFYFELFNYDPDDDQTGDHFRCWARIENLAENFNKGDVIKEAASLNIHGVPAFVANA